ALHTMATTLPRIATFDVVGSNQVDKIRWAEGTDGLRRVYINAEQYFGQVPDTVWNTHIGGYRVADKWLKDRRGRQLNYDDLEHYQSVIAALARTVEIQAQIDQTIEQAGGWPLA
ncbi:MAG: type ISP restriction/modification enzyme, partial [Lysobacterales bacterium]